MKHEETWLRLRGSALILFLLLTVAVWNASCKRASVENGNAANANTVGAAEDTSTTPPYQTKEPDRYQATVVTTGSIGGPNAPGAQGVSNQQVSVARDGEQRRMEFELLPGVRMTFLQLSEGSYMLYPAKKMYAEVKRNEGDASKGSQPGVPGDFSADKLLNQSRTGARYEKLGAEEVAGRMTTKYRVTTRGTGGEGEGVSTETLVWVDESLGMPIRSETTTTGGANNGSKFSMEIRDIKLEVDPAVFTLPKDYRKVSREDIQREALSRMPGLVGSDGEERKETGNKKQ